MFLGLYGLNLTVEFVETPERVEKTTLITCLTRDAIESASFGRGLSVSGCHAGCRELVSSPQGASAPPQTHLIYNVKTRFERCHVVGALGTQGQGALGRATS
jgi:hypothetical protein